MGTKRNADALNSYTVSKPVSATETETELK